MLTREQISRLDTVFRKHAEIVLAYLFGSQATGRVSPMSDIDIAILFRDDLSVSGRFRLQLRLISAIGEILQRNDIDVANLNSSDVVLRYQVLKKGKLLYCANHAKKNEFFVDTLCEYFDAEPMRELYRKEMKKQIKEKTFLGRSQRFAEAAREAEELYRAFEIHRQAKKGRVHS